MKHCNSQIILSVFYTFAFYRFVVGGSGHRKARLLQNICAPVRDAEFNAIDLAKELNTEIAMSWQDPVTMKWHVFGKYFPDGTRRLFGESVRQSFDEEHQTWYNIAENKSAKKGGAK